MQFYFVCIFLIRCRLVFCMSPIRLVYPVKVKYLHSRRWSIGCIVSCACRETQRETLWISGKIQKIHFNESVSKDPKIHFNESVSKDPKINFNEIVSNSKAPNAVHRNSFPKDPKRTTNPTKAFQNISC